MWRLFFPPVLIVEAIVNQWREDRRRHGSGRAVAALLGAAGLLLLILGLGVLAGGANSPLLHP